MASADLRKELECSVCLSVYTDPVNLRCGHNFCRVCIDRVLETQEEAGRYFCPQCRKSFLSRPTLHRNITLRNVVETFQSAHADQQEIQTPCTYCVDSPVPAVKSCLMCEASLCEKHLRVHSKSPEHVLTDPSTALGNRKCPVHKKILEYYCTEDSACVCVSCCVIGEHQGHKIKKLEEASDQRKITLRAVVRELMIKKERTARHVQGLQEHKKSVHQKAAGEAKRVAAMFGDLKRKLEDLEKKALSKISNREQKVSFLVSHMIEQLEIKKDELSRKMRHIEELCNTTDPLTLLQEPDTGDLCDTEEGETSDKWTHDKVDLDVVAVSLTLRADLFKVFSEVCEGISIKAADILLDVDTANSNLHILKDKKTTLWSPNQNRQMTSARFQDYPQVLSSQRFSSGQHYWDIDVGESQSWRVGVSYPSAERKGIPLSNIGNNNKSWSLFREVCRYGVIHDSKVVQLPAPISSDRVRVCLDYESGRISFYDLCTPIQHLHSFTTTFTEPLHASLGVWQGCVKSLGKKEK
ncbi:E3 ubiquitin/ISG15 ligase TRIM25-like [Gastrophryne carolinensis]